MFASSSPTVAKLKDMVQDALDENRMLVLGVQVLIGFAYRAPFEKTFAELPRAAQYLELTSLGVLLLTLALLLTPGAHQRLVERGEDTPAFVELAAGFASVALLPFAAALGLDLAVAGLRLGGVPAAIGLGVATCAVALGMWYGVELVFRPSKARRRALAAKEDDSKTEVRDKIRHVLTESRVVLPGAQALLGFQFATMLMEGFDQLPLAMKALHLASLCAMAIAIVLLITPAAWHRIVERGEETERMHKFSSAMVVSALLPIALGLSGDFVVVVYKVTRSYPIAVALGGAVLVMFIGFWFVLTLASRHAVANRRATA